MRTPPEQLTSDTKLIVVTDFFGEGTEGKKFVATGDAAVGRDAEKALQGSGKTVDMLRRDTLEIVIAANAAMRGETAR